MEIIRAFNNNELQMNVIIKGTHKNPLFRASDIAEILGISNIRTSIVDYTETEKTTINIHTIGGNQNVTFLTTRGLYKLLIKSKKPIAIKFQNWVYEVVDEIRLTGEYKLKQEIKEKEEKLLETEQKLQKVEENAKQTEQKLQKVEENVKEAEETIKKLEMENSNLLDEKIPSIYIYNTNTGLSKPELKIGYTTNVHNRIKPYKQVCKRGRLEFSYQIYNKNIKVFESFIHNLLSDYLIKDEVFCIDVEEAKHILLSMSNKIHLLKITDDIERQTKIKKLLDYENEIIHQISTKISTNEISTQTDFDDEQQEEEDELHLTSRQIEENENTKLFKQFIQECCIVRKDVEVNCKDIEGQYRIWGKTASKEIFLSLHTYLKTRFNYIRIKKQDTNGVNYGFEGITLKEIQYKKSPIPSKEQEFIFHACVFSSGGKVLHNDLVDEYKKWKQSLNMEITRDESAKIKEYLKSTDYTLEKPVWTIKGNGIGYYGLSLKNQTDIVKRTSSNGKKVEKKSIQTEETIGTWETIAKAADSEKISATKLSRSIKKKTIFNNDYYYCLSD